MITAHYQHRSDWSGWSAVPNRTHDLMEQPLRSKKQPDRGAVVRWLSLNEVAALLDSGISRPPRHDRHT
jgi:hypothetical protein